MRLQRLQMIKLLILECQTKRPLQQFTLMEDIQRVSQLMVNDCQFFMNHAKSKFFQQCIVGVSNLVKMFDTSANLFKQRPQRLSI